MPITVPSITLEVPEADRFGVGVHGRNSVFSSIFHPALFLHSLQQLFSRVSQSVFL